MYLLQKYLLGCICLLVCLPACFAQTISGKIENKAGEKIAYAQILLKDSITAFQIKEFFFANNGVYSFQPQLSYPQLVVEVYALGYRKAHLVIPNYQPKQSYQQDFILEIETNVLNEVVISASKRYEQKEDTVTYNVQAFRDGTEKKIEDVIKKLPGVEVDDQTGKIKYKGKPVETVSLDGDNLFDKNYTIGTRNIDVDMVEQVQAIENYSENPLLKGIEGDEKVALNLVLKKMKMQYSGSADVGLGLFVPNNLQRATDVSANVLGITNKLKSFATLSHNNIGKNNTPYDYAGYSITTDMTQNPAMFAPRYIPETYFDVSNIDQRRSNLNNTLFGSFNILQRVNQHFTIKANLLYLNDRISAERFNQSNFAFNNENFTTSDQIAISKIPNRYVGKLDLKYNLSAKSLVEYNLSFDAEKINTTNTVLQNNTTTFNTKLLSQARLLMQNLTYTYRFSKTKAFQLFITHTFHKAPQTYTFTPAVYEPQTYLANYQTSAFEKNYTEVKTQLLGKQAKPNLLERDKSKFELSAGGIRHVSNFNTNLVGSLAEETQNIPTFANRGVYERYTAYTNGSYRWAKKRWIIRPALKLAVMAQTLKNFITAQRYEFNQFIVEPLVALRYKIGSISALSASAGYKQNPFSEEYFIQNPVYISSRGLRANEISLQLQQHQFMQLGYNLNDFSSHFQFSLVAMYAQNRGNYFNNLNIQSNSTSDIAFFLPENATTKTIALSAEQYVHSIKSSIRFRSNYMLRDYKNLVGNLTLRNNQNTLWSNELSFKTALDIKINFENKFRYYLLAAKSDNGSRFSNQSFSNNFQIIATPTKKIWFTFSQDYFLQNISKPNNAYYFADLSCQYTTAKLTWQLYFKNISNTQTFQQVFVNDFSSAINQTNLLPRHFLLSTYIRF